jgi:hypothetical protein
LRPFGRLEETATEEEVTSMGEGIAKFPPLKSSQAIGGKASKGIGRRTHSEEEGQVESFVALPDGRLAEEILTSAGPKFLLYVPSPESWSVVPSVSVEGKEVFPVPVDPKLRGALMLSDGVEEYGTTGDLLAEMDSRALEIFDPRREGPILRLWVRLALASWIMGELYESAGESYAPILQTVGPPESGKGRLLLVMRILTYRAFYMLKTTRTPSIFRALEDWRNGTLILDEADLGDSSESSDLVEFLNARAYGVPVPRFSGEGDRMRYFRSFGLTILATRSSYEDAGFNSRTIPLRAEATDRTDAIDLIAPSSWLECGRALQRKLLLWRLRHLAMIRQGRLTLTTKLEIPKVEAFRLRTALLPLLALGKEEPRIAVDLAEIARQVQARLVTERAESPEGLLLGYIYGRIGEDGWSIVIDEKEYRLEETNREAGGPGEDPIARQIPLTLKRVSEGLGKALSPRTISRVWRAFGQRIKAKARYPHGLESGLLLISDVPRLEQEFRRYVSDASPVDHLFPARKEGAAHNLTEHVEHTEQTDSQPGGFVPHVPHVPPNPTRGEGTEAGSGNPIPERANSPFGSKTRTWTDKATGKTITEHWDSTSKEWV